MVTEPLNDFENIILAVVCIQWLGRWIDRRYRERLFKYLGQGEMKTESLKIYETRKEESDLRAITDVEITWQVIVLIDTLEEGKGLE